MKASEYIARIQELIEVVGDVEVIIEKQDEPGLFEIAQCETQNVISANIGSLVYSDRYTYDPIHISNNNKILTFIKVW